MPAKKSAQLFDLDSACEALTEKRVAAREKALSEIRDAARKDCLGSGAPNHMDTLVTNIVACLKKGAKAEAMEACVALQAVLIALHESAATAFEDNLYSLGLQLRSNRSDTVRSKIAGLIAIGSLMCSDEESITRIMQRLSGYFSDASTEVYSQSSHLLLSKYLFAWPRSILTQNTSALLEFLPFRCLA